MWGTTKQGIPVKFSLDGQEIRKITLEGNLKRLCHLLELLEQRFSIKLDDRLTYVDGENDHITITTDEELSDALRSNISRFSLTAAASVATMDDWELLPADHEQTPEHENAEVWANSVTFWVNGKQVTLINPKPSVTLLDWLREEHALLGVHVGCGEGGCGICTVALVLPDGSTVPINSCLRRVAACDGCHIISSEGLGSSKKGEHAFGLHKLNGKIFSCTRCTKHTMHVHQVNLIVCNSFH